MKIALIHDDLIQQGGAEQVLMQLHKIYPDAPVYTSVASKKWKKICKKEGIELKTSFLQRFPFVEKLNRFYSPFLFHALAFQSFDFSEYDVVISVSARYAHGILTKPHTTHICYMNSPGRMFWESGEYFKNEDYGALKPLKKLARPFLAPFLSHLRKWDYVSAQKVDYFIANSKTPHDRIKKYYRRDSRIIYPFIDFKFFEEQSKVYRNGNSGKSEDSTQKLPSEKYFLVITRLQPWKKVDLAIKACRKLNKNLKILGRGSDVERLQKLIQATDKKGRRTARSNIEIITEYVSAEEKTKLITNAEALINTQREDFGIVPLEAMACGTPVIAFGQGGVLETVIPGVTGEFFETQEAGSLAEALKEFSEKGSKENYDLYKCQDQAKKFDVSVFEKQIKEFVECVYEDHLQNLSK